MKKLLLVISIALMANTAKAQCTNKIQIEAILVNACNGSGAVPEEYNEMVRFRTGGTSLNITNISIAGTGTVGVLVANKWPNNNQHWNGLSQNATTSALTASLQATVISPCGRILEPPAGNIPANKEVILVTSQQMTPAYNSFASLIDTIYIVYQTSVTTTGGHFANHSSSGARTFAIFDNLAGCSDTVTYQCGSLTSFGGNYDGGTVNYDDAGNPTYTNLGCHAPFVSINATINAISSKCNNAAFNLTGIVSGPAVTYTWTTNGLGTVSPNTGTLSGTSTATLTPTYTPSATETGIVTFTLTGQGKCLSAQATSTVSVFINPTPSPTITSSNGAAICNGNSTLLTASNSGTLTTTYAWNPGGATTSTLSVSPPTGTQIYTLTATTSCGSQNATFTVNTNPLPTITVPNDSICPGGTGTLTATGANTYTWTSGATTNTISASPASNTSYSVTGTNTVTTCKNTASGSIIVRTLPTITTNTNAICSGTTSTLTASGGATNSYTWTPGGPSGNNTYTLNPSGASVITVTGADAHGCKNTNTVTVHAQATLTVNNPTTCSGQAVTLQALPNSLTTYTWTGVASSASSATVAPAGTTSYTVVGTDGNGCKSTSAVSTVSVTAGSQITVSSSNPLPCIGSTYTLTGNGASTYTWIPSSGTYTSLDANSTQISVVQSATSVTFAVSGVGSCPATPTVITINPAPVTTLTLTASPANATTCSGGTVTLTAAGANSYTWNPSITNGTAFTPTASANYTVNATDANGCAATQATESVTVNALPVFTVTSPSVCPGQMATITASQATYTYSWQGSASTGTSITVTPVSFPTQTYSVQALDGNGCFSTVVTSTVTTFVSPIVSASSNPSNATICMGSSITLNGNGAQTYTWSGGITNGTAFTPAASQNYTLTGTDVNSCTATATQSVTVNQLPTVTASSASICKGDIATLNAGGAITYTWSTLETTPTITVQPTATTNYTVVGTDLNNCSNFAVATVVVNNLPTITINASATSVCAGNTVTLTANGAGAGGSYEWDNGSNNNPITDNPTVTTTYTVIGTDVNSCSNYTTITINTNSVAVAQSINPVGVLCKGLTTTLSTNNVSGNTYTWTGPAGFNQTGSSVNITNPGTYTLIVGNGCGPIAPVTVTVSKDSVIAGFNANPTSGQTPVTVSYTNTSVALSGNTLTYSWSFGNGAAISTATNPTEVFTGAGVYQTTLTATDNLGCQDTASIYITVKDIPEVVIIPNIFTPNGDNLNDVFFITASGISNLECKIYDRWGLLLYNWTGLDGFWDGKAKNGTVCTDGTYFYLVTYTDNQGKSVIKNGFFQLIR